MLCVISLCIDFLVQLRMNFSTVTCYDTHFSSVCNIYVNFHLNCARPGAELTASGDKSTNAIGRQLELAIYGSKIKTLREGGGLTLMLYDVICMLFIIIYNCLCKFNMSFVR